MRFALDPGAPAGATLDPVTGLFRWRPSDIQGPSTNTIVVRVSDGVVSTPRSFQVIVRDTRADFELAIGRAVVKSGGSTNLPVTVKAGIDLVEFSGRVRIADAALNGVSWEGLAASVATASLQPEGPGSWSFKLDALPGQSFQGTDLIGSLRIDTASGGVSGSYAIEVEALSGLKADGTSLRAPRHVDGHLTVLGVQPVLALIPGSPSLRLYANPGDRVVLEGSSSVESGAIWTTLNTYSMTGSSVDIDPSTLSRSGVHLFLRVHLAP